MERRSHHHDYTRPGIYHITLHVAEGRGCILGTVVGDPMAPDGSPDAPHVELTAVGQMVEQELLTDLPARYPMVTIDTYVIMPDHLHLLAVVTAPLVSTSGKSTHLGMVIKGFKYGCNRHYWQLLGLPTGHRATKSPGTVAGASVPADSVGGSYPSLFAEGYCDVMPVDAEQLETQRAYIRENPRSRLLRMAHRDHLTTRRGTIPTALSVSALMGYLRHECIPSQATPEALEALAGQLLIRPTESVGTLCPPVPPAGQEIVCDSYGDRALLERSLLPVVCHRKDKPRIAEQKQRCLEEAQRGAVLVSPRIAKGEQEIIDEAVHHGFPVVLVADNGFPDRYHPSATQLDRCAAGLLLLVTPWRYRYRPKDAAITVAECKTMNCIAQALCRQSDSWWKEPSAPKASTGLRSMEKKQNQPQP